MRNNRASPVRPYKRFMDGTSADSGVNMQANYARFVIKESGLDKYRESRMGTIPRKGSNTEIPKGKVPHGTTKCTYKMGLSTDAKLDRTSRSIEVKTFPVNPTDHISQENRKEE